MEVRWGARGGGSESRERIPAQWCIIAINCSQRAGSQNSRPGDIKTHWTVPGTESVSKVFFLFGGRWIIKPLLILLKDIKWWWEETWLGVVNTLYNVQMMYYAIVPLKLYKFLHIHSWLACHPNKFNKN